MPRGSGLVWEFDWRTTAFAVILVPLMVSLGFWQLQRADEKARITASWEARQAMAPTKLPAVGHRHPEALTYLPVKLFGNYRQQTFFLLDNQVRRGKFGYEVLALFEPAEGGELVLVNRGWIAGDASRQTLPEVDTPSSTQELQGYVYVSPGEPYLLAEQNLEGPWPRWFRR